MYSNSKDVAVKVQYQVKGKKYGGPDEGSELYPFDEIIVGPGAEVDLGKAKIINEIEMPEAGESSPVDYRG